MTRDAAEVTWDSGRVSEIAKRIQLVPDCYRNFELTVGQVLEDYDVPGLLLEELLDLGLPHRGDGAGRKFCALDLENIGNALGLYIPGWRSMRLLTVTFGGIKDPDEAVFRIRSASSCPEPRHSGECDVRPSPALVATGNAIHVDCDPRGLTAHVRLRSQAGSSAGQFVAPLVQLARSLTFHYLPLELRDDLGFATETGLADCHLGSLLLVANAHLTGRPVRLAAGLIMSVPFLLMHEWIQVEIDGNWISLDPFFLNSLARWQIIDPQAWPMERPVGDIYWPFPSAASLHEVCLVTDHGRGSQGVVRIANWRDVFVYG